MQRVKEGERGLQRVAEDLLVKIGGIKRVAEGWRWLQRVAEGPSLV